MNAAKMIAEAEEQQVLGQLVESLQRATSATARWKEWPNTPEIALTFVNPGHARAFHGLVQQIGGVSLFHDTLDSPPSAPAPPAFVPPADAPSPPYLVTMARFGPGEGVLRPSKVYSSGGGQLLSPEEQSMWEYVKWLEAEVTRLRVCPAGGPAVAKPAA